MSHPFQVSQSFHQNMSWINFNFSPRLNPRETQKSKNDPSVPLVNIKLNIFWIIIVYLKNMEWLAKSILLIHSSVIFP